MLLQRLPIIYKLKFFFLRNMRTVECGREREGGELMLGSAFLCMLYSKFFLLLTIFLMQYFIHLFGSFSLLYRSSELKCIVSERKTFWIGVIVPPHYQWFSWEAYVGGKRDSDSDFILHTKHIYAIWKKTQHPKIKKTERGKNNVL